MNVPALNASRHVFAAPEQWSAASLSQAPPFDVPVQVVDEDAKPSAGQAPELPVQVSATSHAPADGRQTLVRKTSTQVFAVPEQ